MDTAFVAGDGDTAEVRSAERIVDRAPLLGLDGLTADQERVAIVDLCGDDYSSRLTRRIRHAGR